VSHTPGPWRLAESYRPASADHGVMTYAPYVVDTAGRNVAAAMIGGFEDMREVDANARLIAAAPALLEALEEAVAFLADSHRGLALGFDTKAARAIIRKATTP